MLPLLRSLFRPLQHAPLPLPVRALLAQPRSFSRLPGRDARVAARAEAASAAAHRRAAEARKANAEACAAEFEAGAAKARAEAEAAKGKIEVEVAASKARAEAEAATARAEAEAAKAKIDIEAASSKAREEEFRALRSLLAGGLAAGLAILGALWLGYDYLTHSFGPYVRWQMKRKLQQGPLESALPVPPIHELPALSPSFDSGLPIIMLGHTGSGKSTMLGRLARDFKRRGVPVVYFRLRNLGSEMSSDASRSEAKTFISVASAVFEAIGYPPRPSLLSRLSFLRWSIGRAGVSADVEIEDAREELVHFQHAVSDLFSVCKELYGERGHCSCEDRAPVILADELHDLVHNDRMKRIGGELIFRQLAAEITTNCTDARTVRFCAAASSFALHKELSNTVARDFRTLVFTTSDPPAEAVQQRLRAIGFSEATAELIMGTCGTRLRLLSPFLSSTSAGSMEVAPVLQHLVGVAQDKIIGLFSLVQGDAGAKRELGLLLDTLCAGGEGGVSELGSKLQAVHPLVNPSTAAVLYLDCGNTLVIQSQPYCVAWKKMREGAYRKI